MDNNIFLFQDFQIVIRFFDWLFLIHKLYIYINVVLASLPTGDEINCGYLTMIISKMKFLEKVPPKNLNICNIIHEQVS